VQQAALAVINPEDLPFDPESPQAQDRAAMVEPADEGHRRRRFGRRRGARKGR
jgi:hypothetical protein